MNRLLRSYPLPAFALILTIVFGLERLMQLSETPNSQRVWLMYVAWLAFLAGLARWASIAQKNDEEETLSPVSLLLLAPAFFFAGLILLAIHLVLPYIDVLYGFYANPLRMYDEGMLPFLFEYLAIALLFCGPFFQLAVRKHRFWVVLATFSVLLIGYSFCEKLVYIGQQDYRGPFRQYVLDHYFKSELPALLLLMLIVNTAQRLFRFRSGWLWFAIGAFAGHYLVFSPRFDINSFPSGIFEMDMGFAFFRPFDTIGPMIANGFLLLVWILLLVFLARANRRAEEIDVGREDLVD